MPPDEQIRLAAKQAAKVRTRGDAGRAIAATIIDVKSSIRNVLPQISSLFGPGQEIKRELEAALTRLRTAQKAFPPKQSLTMLSRPQIFNVRRVL